MTTYKIPHLAEFEWQQPIEDKDLSSPPGSPTKGARYIVKATGSGSWSGHDTDIATYNGSGWDFTDAAEGMIVWVKDEDLFYVYTTAWGQLPGTSNTFLALSDTPDSFSSQGSKLVRVNSGATALEFSYRLTVATTAPSGPSTNDIWIDIS